MKGQLKEKLKALLISPSQGNVGLVAKKVNGNRNAPCECGSGKKAKKCCGTEVQYFNRGFNK